MLERPTRSPIRLACLAGTFAMATTALGAAASDGPVTLPRTATHHLTAEQIGQDFRIEVLLPPGYDASESSYPVVYLTDSEMLFPLAAGSLLTLQLTGEVPPIVVVGIAYDEEDLMRMGMLRTRELTPTNDRAWVEQARKSPVFPLPADIEPGGAAAFLDFIERDVKPLVRSTYRVRDDDQTLAGYSLGGLFGLWALFNHSDSFDRYILGSPSIWWHDSVALDYETGYAEGHDDLSKRVFLSVGSLEVPASPEDGSNMVGNLETMFERLRDRGYPGLHLERVVFDGETHTSGPAAALTRGLRTVFQPDWR